MGLGQVQSQLFSTLLSTAVREGITQLLYKQPSLSTTLYACKFCVSHMNPLVTDAVFCQCYRESILCYFRPHIRCITTLRKLWFSSTCWLSGNIHDMLCEHPYLPQRYFKLSNLRTWNVNSLTYSPLLIDVIIMLTITILCFQLSGAVPNSFSFPPFLNNAGRRLLTQHAHSA